MNDAQNKICKELTSKIVSYLQHSGVPMTPQHVNGIFAICSSLYGKNNKTPLVPRKVKVKRLES